MLSTSSLAGWAETERRLHEVLADRQLDLVGREYVGEP